MIKRLLNNVDIKESLGLLILIALFTWYLKMNPDILDKKSTTTVKVSLASVPEYEEGDDEVAENITFKAKGYKNTFEIKLCAINQHVKETVLRLKPNDSLKVVVEKIDIKRKVKRFVYHPISIHGIYHFQKGEILSLDDYNRCQKNSWKMIGILGLLFMVYFLYQVVKLAREK